MLLWPFFFPYYRNASITIFLPYDNAFMTVFCYVIITMFLRTFFVRLVSQGFYDRFLLDYYRNTSLTVFVGLLSQCLYDWFCYLIIYERLIKTGMGIKNELPSLETCEHQQQLNWIIDYNLIIICHNQYFDIPHHLQ